LGRVLSFLAVAESQKTGGVLIHRTFYEGWWEVYGPESGPFSIYIRSSLLLENLLGERSARSRIVFAHKAPDEVGDLQ
jgi:hypothetical protein